MLMMTRAVPATMTMPRRNSVMIWRGCPATTIRTRRWRTWCWRSSLRWHKASITVWQEEYAIGNVCGVRNKCSSALAEPWIVHEHYLHNVLL